MYIQLISIHGLIRGENMELGRDADTGGQVRYVLELAKALSEFPSVTGVDLFTRRIADKRVSADYSREIEQLRPGCRLVRLPCGGRKYMRKERLWPYLDDYVDAVISFTRREGLTPAVVHGHYADGGYIAKEVAAAFDAPFVFTGHSLGKPKLNDLLSEGWDYEQANKEFRIEHRINVEQDCLSVADRVITSTRHERDEQYAEYHKDASLRFTVVPPGTDLDRFFPYYEYDISQLEIDERYKRARVQMLKDLARFHFNKDKPLILALCRPERRKNISALIQAYGESKQLQAIANLAIFAGIREDIESQPENERQALTDMLLAMDRYDLYGKMAIPKHHSAEFDVPELYRITASSGGILVNTAFGEQFGLTAIEASACGLPFVFTQNGGAQDIVRNCKSGMVVDVNDQQALTDSMLTLLTDRDVWEQCSQNGTNLVRQQYTWQSHCSRYFDCIKDVVAAPTKTPSVIGRTAPARRLASLDYLLITDIDNTLLGDDEALERLKLILQENREQLGFGVASGRAPELARQALSEHGIDEIDVIIASVGSEVYYGTDHVVDKGWASRLRSKWRPDRIHEALDVFPFLQLQTDKYAQREFKISYDLDVDVDAEESLAAIHEALARAKAAHSRVFSHGKFIDILPHRASKGRALRYLTGKWNTPLERVVTAGDSGNDRDMLTGRTAGIVVGNHDEELAALKQSTTHRVYFAKAHCAGGIIEGLCHYGVIDTADVAVH